MTENERKLAEAIWGKGYMEGLPELPDGWSWEYTSGVCVADLGHAKDVGGRWFVKVFTPSWEG